MGNRDNTEFSLKAEIMKLKMEYVDHGPRMYLFFDSAGDATVTISHRYTPKDQLRQHTRIADIVVAAAGMDPLLLLKIYLYLV